MDAPTIPLVPGHSVGAFCLGASLHEVLCLVKEDKALYSSMDLHYSQSDPLATPVIVTLSGNGLRLRFHGADQRLRLVEVMDFKRAKLAYKGGELVKAQHEDNLASSGPVFKRVYQMLGASYPGEYLPPKDRSPTGTYVLSWPGVAFTFPLQHSAWSAEKDHVAMLGSHAASPATHMALFEGKSWPEARRDLFVKVPSGPHLSALASRPKDSLPSEVEHVTVHGGDKIKLDRRSPAQPIWITLNETTPQDLVAELGPPDVIHRREEAITAEQHSRKRTGSTSRPRSNGRNNGSQPSSYSSTGTDTFDSDFDSGETDEDPAERTSREKFWCYFSHGMDILIGPPSDEVSMRSVEEDRTPLSASPHLVVIKVVIHGNVPGSYAFNRHRRLQWTLDLASHHGSTYQPLTSEQNFESNIKPLLLSIFSNTWPAADMSTGKVVNRTWGADPSDSSFFLPDAGEDLVEGGNGSEQWLGNTRLYAFPGLTFEVLENGAVSALTVC